MNVCSATLETGAQRVYRGVARAVVLRVIEPGERVDLARLSDAHGVPGPAVARALDRLVLAGVVEATADGGVRASEVRLDHAVRAVRVRRTLEGAAAVRLATALAAGSPAADGALDVLRRLTHEMDAVRGYGDLYAAHALDRRFHCALVVAAGLGGLAPVLDRALLAVARFTVGGLERPRLFFVEGGVGPQHREVLDAIAAGPRAGAAAAARHIDDVLAAWSPRLAAAAAVDRAPV